MPSHNGSFAVLTSASVETKLQGDPTWQPEITLGSTASRQSKGTTYVPNPINDRTLAICSLRSKLL